MHTVLSPDNAEIMQASDCQVMGTFPPLNGKDVPPDWHRVILESFGPFELDAENTVDDFPREGTLRMRLRDGQWVTLNWYNAGQRALRFSYGGVLYRRSQHHHPNPEGMGTDEGMGLAQLVQAAFDPKLAKFVDQYRRSHGQSGLPGVSQASK